MGPDTEMDNYLCVSEQYVSEFQTVMGRVYFRHLKKGVALPLAIVKKDRATPWTYKKGVATPWTCNQSLIKPSGFYSIRCSTFTQTPKQSKEIDQPLSVKYLLKRKQTKKNQNMLPASQNIDIKWCQHASSRISTKHHPKIIIYYAYVLCSNVECITLPLSFHLKRVGLPVAIIFCA